jgi:hypothetical protein
MGTLKAKRPAMKLPSEMVRAVALMDLHHPGWAARVDLSTLDIADPMLCVLGQAVEPHRHGTWMNKLEAMGLRGRPKYCFASRTYQPFWAHVISTRQQQEADGHNQHKPICEFNK